MSAFSNQSSGGGTGAPLAQKNNFKKGLGFVPNSIARSPSDFITKLLKTAPTIPKGLCANSGHINILYESGSTIPLFDIENIAQAEGEERAQLIRPLGIALMQEGFIGIKAPNTYPLVKSVYTEMKRYFQQPFETKLLNWKKNEKKSGFSYRGDEFGPKASRPDFKESFFITPGFNEWPSNNYSFSRVMSEYHSTLSQINNYFMMLLMEFLDEPILGNGSENASNILRLAYYPAFKPGDDPEGVWSAAHRDKNVLSILSNGTVPGLQYYSKNGFWEPVVVPEGYLIITTGLLLQHKTAGLIKARWHRVHNPGGKYTRLQRLSSVFYGTWPEEYSLEPFPNCVSTVTRGMLQNRKKAYLEKFPNITVMERLNTHSSTFA